jgi:hypothetical protein
MADAGWSTGICQAATGLLRACREWRHCVSFLASGWWMADEPAAAIRFIRHPPDGLGQRPYDASGHEPIGWRMTDEIHPPTVIRGTIFSEAIFPVRPPACERMPAGGGAFWASLGSSARAPAGEVRERSWCRRGRGGDGAPPTGRRDAPCRCGSGGTNGVLWNAGGGWKPKLPKMAAVAPWGRVSAGPHLPPREDALVQPSLYEYLVQPVLIS